MEIEEYNQQPKSKNAKGQWSGIYKPLKVHGEKKAGSKTTKAKAVITTVPIEQIAYTFPELTFRRIEQSHERVGVIPLRSGFKTASV